ncbi:basic proline-rich protein-like [Jatropha curcas]|uniref:basic proline-rich protein-like n=1 Tax=Jatropha curcas TaxID=180498 RepID=UPI001892D5AC|nr:basic proline-rich protein-like [Jatropha curcas]
MPRSPHQSILKSNQCINPHQVVKHSIFEAQKPVFFQTANSPATGAFRKVPPEICQYGTGNVPEITRSTEWSSEYFLESRGTPRKSPRSELACPGGSSHRSQAARAGVPIPVVQPPGRPPKDRRLSRGKAAGKSAASIPGAPAAGRPPTRRPIRAAPPPGPGRRRTGGPNAKGRRDPGGPRPPGGAAPAGPAGGPGLQDLAAWPPGGPAEPAVHRRPRPRGPPDPGHRKQFRFGAYKYMASGLLNFPHLSLC